MSELGDLYQELILDHNARPRNFGELDDASHHAAGHNPLCGDTLDVFLQIDGDVVREVRFKGHGCAISKASASLMTDSIKGKTVAEVESLFGRFHELLAGDEALAGDISTLGKLAVFAGVREYPMRVKCATLAWHTVKAALSGEQKTSTE